VRAGGQNAARRASGAGWDRPSGIPGNVVPL